MAAPPNTRRHNNGPLSDDDAKKLWNHIRALETLAEQKGEISDDEKARKLIAKEDGFDTAILSVILKRRKAGRGQTTAADSLLQMYEDALRDQGALPLEETRKPPAEARRDVAQIAEELHGEPAPDDMFDPPEEPPTLN